MKQKWEQFKTTPAYTELVLADSTESIDADFYTEFFDDYPDRTDEDFATHARTVLRIVSSKNF
jgi:hypothetical protein